MVTIKVEVSLDWRQLEFPVPLPHPRMLPNYGVPHFRFLALRDGLARNEVRSSEARPDGVERQSHLARLLNAGCRGTLGTHFINSDVFYSFAFGSCRVWTIHEVPGDARPPYSDSALQRAQLAG